MFSTDSYATAYDATTAADHSLLSTSEQLFCHFGRIDGPGL